ncbi:hypothetical protein BSKO_03075 [Bryopsis sp. KO-2023]|nr:hypothetical protein BSKO_03075 [Bryopsis sp. KO-2023]
MPLENWTLGAETNPSITASLQHRIIDVVDTDAECKSSLERDFTDGATLTTASPLHPCWWIPDIALGHDMAPPSLTPAWFGSLANGILFEGKCTSSHETDARKELPSTSRASRTRNPQQFSSKNALQFCWILDQDLSVLSSRKCRTEVMCRNIHMRSKDSQNESKFDVGWISVVDEDEAGWLGANGNDSGSHGSDGPRGGGRPFGQNEGDANDDENTSDDGDETEDDSSSEESSDWSADMIRPL